MTSTTRRIELTVNGRHRRLTVADDALLLDVLRREFGVTSVREGCGVGACGACTVLVEGNSGRASGAGDNSGRASGAGSYSVSSCLARATRYDKAEVTTADGLPADDIVVDEFVAAGAMQCGYCIPGFVLMAHELLAGNPSPSREQIADHLAGNICRCGTYQEICQAVGAAAIRRQREQDGTAA
jgi:aerobic-type carbon monoxide dehydrogenase small subunit (CoxS/CutS family)